VIQSVLLCLVENDAGPLTDSMDAPKVSCRVQCRIWGPGNWKLWDRSWQSASFVSGGPQRCIRGASTVDRSERILLILIALNGVLRVLALEETHGEGEVHGVDCRWPMRKPGQSSSSVSRREGANTGGKELDWRVSRARLIFEEAKGARQRSAKFTEGERRQCTSKR
jgi:hypothetical protein